MMSVMITSDDGGMASLPHRGNGAVGEQKTVASTSDICSAGDSGYNTVAPTEEAARTGLDGSNETRISDNVSDSRVLKVENDENQFGEGSRGGNQSSSSVSRTQLSRKKISSRSEELQDEKFRSSVDDFYSTSYAYDAAMRDSDSVGYGFKIGDMVWGKVKSHPWWPGFIYNEAFVSPDVRRGKHSGHVLVAFFGDSSYGWFDPAELIPFEENFAEKSKQTTSRSFVKAVEEALDELLRRSGLGLACRCRNEFNLWPSSVEGHFVVDVWDYELGVYEQGVYGCSQISEARDSFRTRDMLSFIQQMALDPGNKQFSTIDFNKNKATTLAYRKSQWEEFDDTYAQAFGKEPVRLPRPTAPLAMDPSKVPLSGRLLIAEAHDEGKVLVKPVKTKDQVEKDKYLFKRREESIQMKSKKGSSSQSGHTLHPLSAAGRYSGLRDHMHQASESRTVDGHHQPISHQASEFRTVDGHHQPISHHTSISGNVKPSEGSRKLIEGGAKKVKVVKRPAGEFIADNSIIVKKKKKKIGMSTETGAKVRELCVAVRKSTVAVENVPGMPQVQHINNNRLGDQKKHTSVGSSSSSQSHQEVDFGKIELQMLTRDLHALALDPFHGDQRSCPDVIKQVFLKFRSLVYEKSLVLFLTAEREAIEVTPIRLPAPTVSVAPVRSTHKIVKPSIRLNDPSKGGRKHGPSDHPENNKKRKLDALEGVKRKKVDDSFGNKKIENSRSSMAERQIILRPTESQRGDVKDIASKVTPPKRPKVLKLELSKKEESPTMLVLKFPSDATLPSGGQLKARFARFGPLVPDATRTFWKSSTCRVVYLHKINAEAALKFINRNTNFFGNVAVRSFIREVEVEAAELEPVGVSASQPRETAIEQKMVAKTAPQPLEHPQSSSVQLKSCLKKGPGDEGGSGGGRSARVKFVLGGEESSKGEMVLYNEIKKNDIGASTSSSIHSSLDLTSKILGTKLKPQLSNTSSSTTLPFQKLGVSIHSSEQGPPPSISKSNNDISQPMLNLLTRCNDVVNNLRAEYGYMSYHTL